MDFSNSWTWMDTAGWVISRKSAAREKPLWEATAWKMKSWWKFIRLPAASRLGCANGVWAAGFRGTAAYRGAARCSRPSNLVRFFDVAWVTSSKVMPFRSASFWATACTWRGSVQL